jgi:serine/threonine-protein kinase
MAELPLVGDEFAGYRIRSVLGRGGMSVVYEAENLRLSSVIALKVLAPELAADDVFRARFLEESRIAASLNHPNVIPIYDMGSQDGLLYIAMRYVSGTDLRQMIKKRGRLLPETALFLLAQAARALDAAHSRGLVHRDVKPGNLLIERGGDEADPDHVYLADFGITKHMLSRTGLTSTGQFMGTVDYVAPEQIRGISVLGLADQYSLGCVLYECLTGRVPFEKDLDAAVIWAQVEETPVMPTMLRPDLPPEIDQVFGRVLAKRPDERYGSCREFIGAAGVALGILEPGTQSSLAYGTMPIGAPSGGQAGAPTERFAWSGVAGQAAAADPVAPGSGNVAAAASPSGPGLSWGSPSGAGQDAHSQPGYGEPGAGLPGGSPTSDRREVGIAGPRGSSWYRQPRWLALAAVLILAVAGLGVWAGLSASGSHGKGATTMPSMSAKPKPKPTTSALMNALILADKSADATGKLPPSTCKQGNATTVTCTAPATGISGVVFQTYPSLKALYAAYTAKASSLNSGQFKQNFNDCESEATYGEVGWNHQFQHPKTYTVDQMSMGMVTDDQAAGRVFCTYTQGSEYMVWTQNDGHLMGYVAGPVHGNVWNWWVAVHHNIGLGGSAMHM